MVCAANIVAAITLVITAFAPTAGACTTLLVYESANLAPSTHAAPAPAVVTVTAPSDYGHVPGNANAATITAAVTQAFANLAPLTHAAPAPAVVAVTALSDYGHVPGNAKICFRSTQALPTSFLLTKQNVATCSSESCRNTLFNVLVHAVNFMTSHDPATLTETRAPFDTFIDAGDRHMQNINHFYHYLMRSDYSSFTLETIQAVRLAYLAGGASNMKSSLRYNALKLDILSLQARSGRDGRCQEHFDRNDSCWAEKNNAFADHK
jgi:hypothetical protein